MSENRVTEETNNC